MEEEDKYGEESKEDYHWEYICRDHSYVYVPVFVLRRKKRSRMQKVFQNTKTAIAETEIRGFGHYIEKYAEEANMSPDDIRDMLQLTQIQLKKLYAGKYIPCHRKMQILSGTFHVPVTRLLKEAGNSRTRF